MELTTVLKMMHLFMRSQAASRYAASLGTIGMEFNRFGKKIGRTLLLKGISSGLDYLLTPVNIVRYFEFAFALQSLPEYSTRYLDVGSPRLFSLYIGIKSPSATIDIINPDLIDIYGSSEIISRLNIPNIYTQCEGVDVLARGGRRYDCIWSISVIEHICGEYDDTYAVKVMYNALNNGGRLILTFPVDKIFHNEYRNRVYYKKSNNEPDDGHEGKHFFQRFYDKRSIWNRLLSPIGAEPKVIRWFGEICPGRFSQYEQRWMNEGHKCSIDDPREIADNYREFCSWEKMPGMGICGLVIEKDWK